MAGTQKTFSVSVTRQLNAFVNAKVESGDYSSKSDVVSDALELLREREREQQLSLSELKAKIESGWAQLRRGEGIDGEQFFDDLERRLEYGDRPTSKPRRRPRAKATRR